MDLGVGTDTSDEEDITDLHQYLLPPTDTLKTCQTFGMHYHRCLFEAWVKQPSPCCAASSLASAINALLNIKRSYHGALNHQDILAVYSCMYMEKVSQKLLSLKRQIGGDVLTLLEQLASNMKSLCIKATDGENTSQISSSEKLSKRSRIVIDANTIRKAVETLRTSWSSDDEASRSFFRLLDSDDITDTSSSSKYNSCLTRLVGLLKAIQGYRSLTRSDKPSTAPIGNADLMSAATRIADYLQSHSGEQCNLHARLLMGATGPGRSKVDIPIAGGDDDEVIRAQWTALKEWYAREDTVLLFHLNNHYTLVYAMREWVSPPAATSSESVFNEDSVPGSGCVNISCTSSEGSSTAPRVHRELLVARRGQRPVHWVDLAEAREIMLGWEGYKIIALSLSSSCRGNCQGLNVKGSLRASLSENAENNPDAAEHSQAHTIIDMFSFL